MFVQAIGKVAGKTRVETWHMVAEGDDGLTFPPWPLRPWFENC